MGSDNKELLLKNLYRSTWIKHYDESLWSNFSDFPFPVPSEKSEPKKFIHKLMVHSMVNYFNEQDERQKELEAQLVEAQIKLAEQKELEIRLAKAESKLAQFDIVIDEPMHDLLCDDDIIIITKVPASPEATPDFIEVEKEDMSIFNSPKKITSSSQCEENDESQSSPSLLSRNIFQRPTPIAPTYRLKENKNKLSMEKPQSSRNVKNIPVTSNVTKTKSGWIKPQILGTVKVKEGKKSSIPSSVPLKDSSLNSSMDMFLTPPDITSTTINETKNVDLLLDLPTPVVGDKCKASNARNNNNHKALVQPTLVQMSKKFPKPTVDLTTCQDYQGGSRISTVPAVKRKSHELSSYFPSNSHQLDSNQVSSTDVLAENIKVKNNSEELDEMEFGIDEDALANDFQDLSHSAAINKEEDDDISHELLATSQPQVGSTTVFDEAPIGESTLNMLANFDKVPRSNDPQPSFKYKPDKAVRKKDERAKLPGMVCDMCREYYEAQDLSPEEIQKLMNKCSKHRAQFEARSGTPPDFWRTDFPNTEECIRKGYLHIEEHDPNIDPKIRNRI